MDLKTTMALRNYGFSPLPSKTQNNPAQSQFQSDFASSQSLGLEERVKSPKSDFASLMKNMAVDSLSTLKTAEQTAQDGLSNKADIQSVVEAMTQAEVTVKTVTAVRDKVVEAYQEILRMPI